jgi:hypothetical protein
MDSNAIYVFSTDPGFVNIGSAYGFVSILKEKILVVLDKGNLATDFLVPFKGCNEENMTRAVVSWLNLKFPKDLAIQHAAILIERQFIHPNLPIGKQHVAIHLMMLESILYAIFVGKYQSFTELVHPGSIKALLQTRGNNYNGNKENAIEFCKNVLKVEVSTDHVANAINQIYWWVQKNWNESKLPVEFVVIDFDQIEKS